MKVAVVTGHAGEGSVEELLKIGVDRHIAKPIALPELAQVIQKLAADIRHTSEAIRSQEQGQ